MIYFAFSDDVDDEEDEFMNVSMKHFMIRPYTILNHLKG